MREQRRIVPDRPPFAELLRRVQAGDEEAWEPIQQLCVPLVRRWCRRANLRPADTQDVVQEICLVLVTPGCLPDQRGIRGWLWGITAHKIADKRRARQRERSGIIDFDARAAAPPRPSESEAAEPRAEAVVAHVRRQLSEQTWQAFEQTAILRRPTKEVAWELGMTPNAVYLARERVDRWLKRHRARTLPDNRG